MIKRSIALIAVIIGSLYAVHAQTPGNPENWCRNGLFPEDSKEFKIGTVKAIASKSKRTYFFNDYETACPTSEACRTKSYIIPGDRVIVSRVYKGFACSWYFGKTGSETTGWIKASDLDIATPIAKTPIRAWLGNWGYGDNSITLTENKLPQTLNVSGEAFWKGLGDNIHFGELDGLAAPKGNVLKFGEADTDEYACKATMHLVGGYLIVADNRYCGGANVTFTGVYRKTIK